jgi:hypothetical protein
MIQDDLGIKDPEGEIEYICIDAEKHLPSYNLD